MIYMLLMTSSRHDPLRRLFADAFTIYCAPRCKNFVGWGWEFLHLVDVDKTPSSLARSIQDVPKTVEATWYKETRVEQDTPEARCKAKSSSKWDAIPVCFTPAQAENVSMSIKGIRQSKLPK